MKSHSLVSTHRRKAPAPQPSSYDATAEMAMLIDVLRNTDSRLEELTEGQVDTVADRTGRQFLLHRAQDGLRYAQSAKQAAIMNALPAHVIIVDMHGSIVAQNDAWRQLACRSILLNSDYEIGLNYLGVCENAQGDEAADARKVARGILGVLRGSIPRFCFEHACKSPAEQAWFLLTVTPLNRDDPSGVVVMYLNITEQKRGEERSRRLGTAMDAIVDAIYLIDRTSMRLVHVNDAACRMQDKTREQLLAMDLSAVLGTSRAEHERIYDALIMNGVGMEPQEMLRERSDGTSGWFEVRRQAQQSGKVWTIVTLVRDITERKAAETRIAYLNRVYSMLSSINVLVVRVHSRDELFKEACRIAVESGGFRLAMMGAVDTRTNKWRPVGLAGSDERLVGAVKGMLMAADGEPTATTARAITERRVIVSNDAQSDAAVFGSKHHEYDVRSMAIFPLIVADQVVGVMSLYANESQFFHQEEIKLLTELTNDVAFAIEHIEKQERLDYLAYYDVLTGLANRTLFLERLSPLLRNASSGGHTLALMLIDLQRFRNINDSLGRANGDALLRQVAEWLTANAGESELLARVGIDLFAVIVPEVALVGNFARFLTKIMSGFLDHPFVLEGAEFRIAAKAGIALFPEDGIDADALFRHAEAALKKAKASGDRYLFYTQKMTQAMAGKLTLENQLYQALDKDQFVLYYQPKVNLASGCITGLEALLRWNDPRTGLVPPNNFIPILEETGLIHEVGRWVLRKAVEDYLRWRGMGFSVVRIAVNVSPLQLENRNFVHEIEQVLGIDPTAAAALELEMTESVVMEDIKRNIECLRAIRGLGVTIAIDDFGTGFSSLSYLAKLPLNTLKIDRSFVTDMTTGPEGVVLVSSIIRLAHSLKLGVVAEGVETERQSRLLRLLKCDDIQGFLYSRPLSREVLEERYLAPGRGTAAAHENVSQGAG